ncbi:hypothetical protein [Enhygromyxa salina]|uniref:hypothetical protein n=1 Tax=Enhygromyxa salina TaxID=215803 RepID=UPI000695BDBD|nr:hypothetical protein [Enhygromyxa salina]
MGTTSDDEHAPEPLELGRAPVDRLLFGCVLAASAAYIGFLIVMQFAPRDAERSDKQGYLGVVSGESQPSGGAGEQDPAAGVAERGGRGSAYYAGGGQTPRPVTISETETKRRASATDPTKQDRPTRIPAAHVQASASSQLGQVTGGLAKLGLSELVAARVEQLVAAPAPALPPASPLGPAGGALNAPPGHVRVGVGPN